MFPVAPHLQDVSGTFSHVCDCCEMLDDDVDGPPAESQMSHRLHHSSLFWNYSPVLNLSDDTLVFSLRLD